MSIKDTAGISLTSGFKLLAEDLLDKRCSLPTEADRDELVSLHAAPVGLIVYVKSTKRTYQYNGNGEWEYFSKGAEYVHPTGDGNLHVPATGTNHNGQFLSAGSTAGSIAWKTITPALIGAAPSVHHHSNDTIDSLDASKLTGVIDAERLPKVALERYTKVADDTARFALTKNDVQNGDTVKVESTEIMYYVIDDTKLDQDAGYAPYVAEKAKEVSWSGITNKPNTMSNEYPLEVKFNGGTANGKDSFTYYGSNKVSINITPEAIDAARKSHTHTKSEITDFPDSLKNPNSLSININGAAYTYDGSEAKSIIINPSTIGAAPAVHTHPYLPLSGGTMTGTINQKNLTLNDGFHNRLIIAAYCESDIGASNNGCEVTFGGGGNIFVGSGESHTALRTALSSKVGSGESYNKTSEQMYFSSDNNIYFYTNTQTIANRVGIVFDSAGALRPLVNNTRTLGSSSIKWNNVYSTMFTGDLAGNATSSTYARLTTLNPTTSTTYFLPFTTGTASNTNYSLNGNDGIRYNSLEGTTSGNGYAFLVLGNGIASGQVANKYGGIRIFGSGSNYINLITGSPTDNRTITFPDESGTVSLTNHTHKYLPLSGGTMTGTINSSKTTTTYLAGNQGATIINSTAGAGSYTMLAKMNSTNGYFTTGTYQTKYLLQYTAKSTVDSENNRVTKSVTLLDESGNSSFPGTVTASAFSGNASSATYATNVRITNKDTANIETFYLPFVSGTISNTNYQLYGNDGLTYKTAIGTANLLGQADLILGNNISEGTAGNKRGSLYIYSTGTNKGQITQAEGSTNIVGHVLPATGGTILNSNTTSFTQSLTSGTVVGTLKINGTNHTLYAPTNIDTHYTSHLYVGASGGNANATTATSNPYLLCVDNTTNRNSVQLKAGSNMNISAVNGVITFTSSYTNTDTKVTQTVTTSNASYPLLLAPSGQTANATTTSYFDSGVTLNPSTNTIAANISGNAATATKLATARTISLTGSITGSGTFDGSGNLSITTTTNHTHSYLPLSGGTLTGTLIQSQGSYVHSADAGSGSNGYIHIATLKINGAYVNAPITIELSKRGTVMSCTLYISFANANSTDPGLGYFKYTGADYGCYISRTSTSTWQLYVTKSEAYDCICVIRYNKPSYMEYVTLTWCNTYVSEIPGSYVTAVVGGNVYNADTVDGFHASQSAGSKSTCVVTDKNGYTNLNYINSNTSNSENPSISQIIVTNGSDNYYRKASLSHLKSSLGLSSYLPLSGGTMTGSPTIKCGGSFNIQPTNSIHIDLDNASSASNIYIRTNLSNSNNGAVLFVQDSRSVSYGQIGIADVANSASTQGVMRLILGNNRVGGHDVDNARGAIRIYGPYNVYCELSYGGSNRTVSVSLPSSSGTLAVNSSDIRLKENIKDTDEDNALGLVNSINFRQFDWKETGKHQKLGFIADELEEIDEHLVLEGTGGYEDKLDEDGNPIMNVKCVDTFYLMGYYGKAIQELTTIIDKQNKRIKALEEQMSKLLPYLLNN